MRSSGRAKRFLSNETYADLVGSIVAGIIVGAFICVIRSASAPRVEARIWSENVLLAVVSYMVIAGLAHRWWTGLLSRIVPKWVLTSVLGSLLLISFISIPVALQTWGGPYQMEKKLG